MSAVLMLYNLGGKNIQQGTYMKDKKQILQHIRETNEDDKVQNKHEFV